MITHRRAQNRTARRNRRNQRNSRRSSKRSRRFFTRCRRNRTQRGGGWGYRIPDTAVVGYKNEEGVEGFETMKEKREKVENDSL
jgi:hypothetical protein